jgi:hypothetical protein
VPQPNSAGAPEAIEQLNTLLHMRLFSSPVPIEVTELKVVNGILTMRVPGEFQVDDSHIGRAYVCTTLAASDADGRGSSPHLAHFASEAARSPCLGGRPTVAPGTA